MIVIAILILLLLHTSKILHKTNNNTVPGNPTPIKNIELTESEILDLIDTKDVETYVRDLASKEFCGRATGSEGNTRAANYIKKHLEILNIEYKEQEFVARGRKTKNIIGYINPKNGPTEKVIVIGAHYDHLGGDNTSYYPGADDNASGVAGLMSICKGLAKYKDKLKHTIVMQFYSAEELGLVGSKYYVNNPLFPENNPNINNHIAMINLDMIGYLKTQYQENENTTRYRDDKSWIVFDYSQGISLKTVVNGLSTKYPFAKHISGYRPGGSDHAPFYNQGIPIVFLHTGLHSNYHKTTDTPDKLDYDGLVKVAKLAFEILIEVDKH